MAIAIAIAIAIVGGASSTATPASAQDEPDDAASAAQPLSIRRPLVLQSDAESDADVPTATRAAARGSEERALACPKPKASELVDRARFRGGVSALGGGYFFRTRAVAFGGVEGRLGVQIRDWVAIYAEPALLVGTDSSGIVARASVGLMPELSVADLWFVGVGPDLYATFAVVNGEGLFASASFFGVHARTGVALGEKEPGRRRSFTMSADLRLDFFFGKPAFAPGVALGYDAW